MKRFYLLFVAMMLGIMLSAQTQQGYVKTKGRLANDGSVIAGTRIPNATIQVKDRTPIVSQADGVFSFPIPAKNFYLINVQKQGYVLTDPEVLSKQYSYSANDLIIVMEDLAQQEADRRAIERKISGKLYTQLLQQGEELDNLREQNKITEEKYRELLQQLNQYQDDNEKIIKDMADRYTKMDFDQIDEFNKKVSEYILNGELTKADSMLRTKGDIHERIDQLNQQHEANVQVKANLEKSESLEQREREDIASDCYRRFEIYKMQHLNDSAAYYLELRANLDTTNIEWQNDAGKFLYEYLADYEKTLSYFSLVLRQSLFQFGEQSNWTSISYINIGSVYDDQGNYEKALEYYVEALTILKALFSENHPQIATTYNNIGNVYCEQGNYEKALEYCDKALNIRKTIFGENYPDVAGSYNNIGYVYCEQGNYGKALEYYWKALTIYNTIFGENHPYVATIYSNIGILCFRQGNYDKALEYMGKTLTIRKTVFGEKHPVIATSYNNIGAIYRSCQGNYDKYEKTLEYYSNALTILKSIFAENHPHVATTYNNIGYVYCEQGNYNMALEYYEKALAIRKTIFGENHPDMAESYTNIGYLFSNQGNYDMALEYYEKALIIYKTIFGENHPNVATLYNDIGVLYSEQGNYDKTLEYYGKALAIRMDILGESHPDVISLQKRMVRTEYLKCLSSNSLKAFCEDHCFTTTIAEGNTPASQQGMSGEYILLEFADWNQDSPFSLFDKINELTGKPKDILVMKNGVISEHHFQGALGAYSGVKYVGKEEKQRINKAYEEWKKQNRKQP